jgi:hypothetical protein
MTDLRKLFFDEMLQLKADVEHDAITEYKKEFEIHGVELRGSYSLVGFASNDGFAQENNVQLNTVKVFVSYNRGNPPFISFNYKNLNVRVVFNDPMIFVDQNYVKFIYDNVVVLNLWVRKK